MPTANAANPLKHVAVVMAMREEAAPVIEALGLREDSDSFNPHLPMRLFCGGYGTLKVSLGIAGVDDRHGVDHIGSEAASLLAYELLRTRSPDLLISAGTAGGFAGHDAEIGTVYLSDRYFVYHDRHVPLAGFRESAVGRYPALDVTGMAAALSLPTGIVSTGSSLEKSGRDVRIIEAHQAVAKEMEAAAVAWVAMLFGVPMMAVKSITNLVDESNQSETEFLKNFDAASRSLRTALLNVLGYLEGKAVADLAN